MKGGETMDTLAELQQQRNRLLEMPITFQDAFNRTEKFETITAQLAQIDVKIRELDNQIER